MLSVKNKTLMLTVVRPNGIMLMMMMNVVTLSTQVGSKLLHNMFVARRFNDKP
jgi:hypothetical protein